MLSASVAAPIYGPQLIFDYHGLAGTIGIAIALSLLCAYMNFKLIRAIYRERFTMKIEAGTLFVTDVLRFKKRALAAADIKGFSLSEYPLRGFKFKSILVYLKNGEKLEFPQFLFLNFRKLAQCLEQNGIRFLGNEPYVWKWIDSRYYKYDGK